MRRIIIFTFLLVLLLSDSLYSQNINKPNIDYHEGLKVNSFSGQLFYQRTDLSIPGRGLSIDLTFSYNSGVLPIDYGFGPKWTMPYSMTCKPNANASQVIVRHPDGRRDDYIASGNNFITPTGIFDVLEQYEPGKYKITTKSGIVYKFDNSSHSGVTSIADPNGNITKIEYTGPFPTKIIDASNRVVNLIFNNGHLDTINDPNSSPPRKVVYKYDSFGNPDTVIDLNEKVIEYKYDSQHRLTNLFDQLRTEFKITYVGLGNVSGIKSPLDSIHIEYDINTMTTTFTKPVNGMVQSTSYMFNTDGNMMERIGNCCGFHENFIFDASKNVEQKEDANGNNWNYLHDTRGNTTEETDPMGGKTKYQYEPNFNHVAKSTDKRGNVTDYQYDGRGNLTQVRKPLGVTENYSYDLNGDLRSYTDGRGFTTQYAYNAHGYRTLITYPDGSRNSFTYDGVGNMTSSTDANRHTTTMKYDKLNRVTHTTDALRQTTSNVYDDRGDLLSTTDPLGHSISHTYDALHRRKTTTTPAGTTKSDYDEEGNMIRMEDANHNVTRYTYDTRNRMISEINTIGHSRNFAYDENGNKVSESDFKGGITSYVYDALNRMTRMIDALSNVTNYYYDENGNHTTVKNARGHATDYTYDELNRVIQMKRPIGTTTYTYDANDNKTSETDPNLHTTVFNFDEMNRQTTVTDALGNKTFHNYDAQGNLTSIKNRNRLTTAYVYDALNRRVREINPLGETSITKYDPAGRVSSVKQPNGNLTSYSYDAADRLISVSDLIGLVGTYSYDANSNRKTETDGNGHTTTNTYDALNRVSSTTDLMGNTVRYTYNNNSSMVNMQDRSGHITYHAYDALERKISTTHPEGNRERTSYDAVGNVKSMTDDNEHTTLYFYDANDRLIKEVFADGSQKIYNYDNAGNLIKRTDGENRVTDYFYDELNRLETRNYLTQSVETFTYDSEGRMLTANNPNADISFKYDNADRLEEEKMNGKITAYTYDIPGRKRTITYPEGKMVTENYDHRSRLSQVNGIASYTYDAGNRMLTRTYSNGVVANYTYNNNDWITKLSHKRNGTGASGKNGSYQSEGTPYYTDNFDGINDSAALEGRGYKVYYRGTGTRDTSHLWDNGDSSIFHAFNGPGEGYVRGSYEIVHDIGDIDNWLVLPAKNVSTGDSLFFYSKARGNLGLRDSIRVMYSAAGDSVPEAASWIELGRFEVNIGAWERRGFRSPSSGTNARFAIRYAVVEGGPNGKNSDYFGIDALTIETQSIPSDTIANFNYAFDNEGNRLSAQKSHRPTNSEKYIYDVNDRIKTYKEGTLIGNDIMSPLTQTNFNYDGVGNRTTVFHDADTTTYTPNNVNAYISIDTGNGPNIKPDYFRNGNTKYDGILNYFYDFENRLTSVTETGPIATYQFDALGRRVQKVTTAGTINYFYDGQRIIEERNGSNALKATYVYGTWIDDILNMNRSDTNYFYHQNSLGSVAAVTNNSGTVVERYEYDTYGQPSIYADNYTLRTSTAIGNTYMFTGREYDTETRNYHYRARFYKPDWGRFGQWDPIGNWAVNESIGNAYIYARNNSQNFVDPSGNQEIDCSKRTKPIKAWLMTGDARNPKKKIVSNLSDASAYIAGQLGDDCCIGTLLMSGHGNETGMDIREENSTADQKVTEGGDLKDNWLSQKNAKKFVEDLKSKACFCKECKIYILSCNVGLGKLPNELVQHTRCTVYAPKAYCVKVDYEKPLESELALKRPGLPMKEGAEKRFKEVVPIIIEK